MSNKQTINPRDIEFGKRFKSLRMEDFKGQADIAEFLGVQQPLISKIESGAVPLGYEYRSRLVKEKKWNSKFLDFGTGNRKLNKSDERKSTITDINDMKMEIEFLKDQIELSRQDVKYILNLYNELKSKIK